MATTQAVQALYIAYFGRPADPSGRTYWTADTTATNAAIANGFAETAEYKSSIEGKTTAEIINGFYVNLFGRNAEVAGLNYWTNEIALGRTTTQAAGQAIGEQALAASPANSDTVALQSKFTAAQQWTDEIAKTSEATLAYTGSSAIQSGVTYLTPVTTTATVPTAASTTSQVATLVSTGTGATSTLELSVLQDIASTTGYTQLSGAGTVVSSSSFKFTAGNETINGTQSTFGSAAIAGADSLLDTSTTDEDVLNLTAVTNVTTLGDGSTGTASTISNIETVKVALSSAATGAFNATAAMNYAGTDTVSFTGSMAANAVLTYTATGSAGTLGDVRTIGTEGVTGTGASVTINGAAATAALTINGSTALQNTITGGSGADTIKGGNTLDNITGNGGADSMTGGTGADNFINVGIDGGAVAMDTITDFSTSSTDQVGNWSLGDFLTWAIALTDLDTATNDVAAGDAVQVFETAGAAGFDLDSTGANDNLLQVTTTFSNNAAVQTRVRTYLAGSATTAAEGFLLSWSDGTDTYISAVDYNAVEADGDALAAATVTDLVKINGIANPASIAEANFLAYVA